MKRRAFMLSCLLSAIVEATPQYAKVLRGLALQFPRDHGAHPDYRTEWWYVTGALDLPRNDIGFQLTFFRVRTGFAEALGSPIAASQILFAHAAVTLPGDKLLHAERAARANLGAGFSTTDCDVHIGAWQMQRNAPDVFKLKVQDAQFAFDFSLTPTQPKMLQGDAGFSQKGARAEQASYYVTWPQLQVNGSIVLDVNSQRAQLAKGKAWFDHEWSSEVLGEADVGWDWLGINLADGGALMAFRIRDAASATAFAHATLRDAAGRTQTWSGADVQFEALRKWRSARGTEYPVETELRFGSHVIRTKPAIDDQELSTRRPAPVTYWEGLVQVEGTLIGRGYLELTGYAGKILL